MDTDTPATSNVINLAKITGDYRFHSEGTTEDYPSKALMIALDDTEGGFNVSWSNHGMSFAEVIAVLETMKQTLFIEECME